MAILIKLQDVVDALELPDEWQALLDPDTGEIITISDEEQDYAEDASLDPSELSLFRATTERLGLRDDWFRYREDRLKQIARDWLDAHGIAYTEA